MGTSQSCDPGHCECTGHSPGQGNCRITGRENSECTCDVLGRHMHGTLSISLQCTCDVLAWNTDPCPQCFLSDETLFLQWLLNLLSGKEGFSFFQSRRPRDLWAGGCSVNEMMATATYFAVILFAGSFAAFFAEAFVGFSTKAFFDVALEVSEVCTAF